MLRKDTNASFVKYGIGPFSQFRFHCGALEARKSLSAASYRRVQRQQEQEPVEVLFDEARRRHWWLFRHEVFWEDEGLDVAEVKALLLARDLQKDRRIQRAIGLVATGEAPTNQRPAIPEEVKTYVWTRDAGRCVSCGSQQLLEFDHVIPLASGGSSTARNLQLLCQTCNRQKGPSLF